MAKRRAARPRPESRRPRVKVRFTPTEDYFRRVQEVARMRHQFYASGVCRGRLDRIVNVWQSDRWTITAIRDVLFYRTWAWVAETSEGKGF